MEIARVEGDDLKTFAGWMGDIVKRIEDGGAAFLHIAIDTDGVKFKVNEGIWSPGIGTRGN